MTLCQKPLASVVLDDILSSSRAGEGALLLPDVETLSRHTRRNPPSTGCSVASCQRTPAVAEAHQRSQVPSRAESAGERHQTSCQAVLDSIQSSSTEWDDTGRLQVASAWQRLMLNGERSSSPSGRGCSMAPRRESTALPMLDNGGSSNTKLGVNSLEDTMRKRLTILL